MKVVINYIQSINPCRTVVGKSSNSYPDNVESLLKKYYKGSLDSV